MKHSLLLSLVCLVLTPGVDAQRSCGSHLYYESLHKSYPAFFKSARGFVAATPPYGVITIPVVVHIIYNTSEENLSAADIESQLETLNRDYQGVNADIDKTPGVFRPYLAGDCQIRFVLKKVTHVKTNTSIFNIDLLVDNADHPLTPEKHPIKFTRLGGEDAWFPTQYLNIWVGNIVPINASFDNLLGLGTFPGGPAEFDGVIINYKAFGSLHATSPYDRGRTATHEVGHWLNLIHISGDSFCGDDSVMDTPVQESQNGGSPDFPLVNCTNAPNGAMFMNYMDYVNDTSMVMFTQGQKDRMRAVFARDGFRKSFVSTTIRDTGNIDFVEAEHHLPPAISKVIQTQDQATIKWTKIRHVDEYEVALRDLRTDEVRILKTKDNSIEFRGLSKEGLYEAEVTAKLPDYSITSIPYRFIAYSQSFNK